MQTYSIVVVFSSECVAASSKFRGSITHPVPGMTIKDEQSRVLHSTMYKGLVHCAIVPDFGEVNFWALMASPLRDEEKSTSNEY
jgi:hypothetical protein